MKHFRILVYLIALLEGVSLAQEATLDSIFQLEEVLIESSRLQYFTSAHTFTDLDSAAILASGRENLADLLRLYTPVFIKSYGLGSLATSSMRGTGASHTAILWNGINLQSPANGQLDLALVPSFFLDEVRIQHGGSSALFGSGAIGGVIHLHNHLPVEPGVHMSARADLGSYGHIQQGYKLAYSNPWLSTSLKLIHSQSDNDFTYTNFTQPGSPTVSQSNAHFQQYGLLQENLIRLTTNQQLDLRLWYQFTDRGIPPTMLEAQSEATQEDVTWRLSGQWRGIFNKWQLAARMAFLDERLEFADPRVNLLSNTTTRSTIGEIEGDFFLSPKITWNAGINSTNQYGKADNYGETRTRELIAAFSSLAWEHPSDRISAHFSVRQEFSAEENAPFVPSVGLRFQLRKHLVLKSALSRSYRRPTFNDLFWIGAGARGNENLDAESGWSQEVTLLAETEKDHFSIKGNITAFNSNIQDWILWSPDSTAIWTPNNILSVHSRGVETNVSGQWQVGRLGLRLSAGYDFVSSTNEKVQPGNEQALNKQLIHVPRHKFRTNFTLSTLGYGLTYGHKWVGSRFTTTDNTSSLPAYHTGHIRLSKRLGVGKLAGLIYFQINNIWNSQYQVIAFRPMPGRNYQLGINIQFETKTKI